MQQKYVDKNAHFNFKYR